MSDARSSRGLCALTVAVLLGGSLPGGLSAQVNAVFANLSQPNRTCLGDGHGGFSCSDVSLETNQTLGVALGFIDSDPNLDAVFGNSRSPNRVCLGDGGGSFSCSDVSSVPGSLSNGAVALGFVDGDGNLDAVFGARYWDEVDPQPFPAQICLGTGDGDFSCSGLGTTFNDSDVALGFIDGDSHLDVVFAGDEWCLDDLPGACYGQANPVCLGDGEGGFSCTSVAGSGCTDSVALGHLNGDHHLDAVFGNSQCCEGDLFPVCTGGENFVCLGDGSSGMSCSNMNGDKNHSLGVALDFIDGDPHLDAVFANRGEPNRVCLGDGGGSFSCSDVSNETNWSFDVALGFIDGDSYIDAVFSNRFVPNRVCFGDGSGGFSCEDVSDDSNDSLAVALGALSRSILEIPTLGTAALTLLALLLALLGCLLVYRRRSMVS